MRVTIDCDEWTPAFTGSYLRISGDECAFIETATSHVRPRLLAALEQQGLRPEAVRYVVVTHAHLDHSAGASALLAACPRATLLAHPRAARHLIDPSKLVQSATGVYGEERFAKLPSASEADTEDAFRIFFSLMQERDRDEWIERFTKDFDVAAEPFLTTQEGMDHPQVLHKKMVVELDDPTVGHTRQMAPIAEMTETPMAPQGPAPALGQHTQEVAPHMGPAKRQDDLARFDLLHGFVGAVTIDIHDTFGLVPEMALGNVMGTGRIQQECHAVFGDGHP